MLRAMSMTKAAQPTATRERFLRRFWLPANFFGDKISVKKIPACFCRSGMCLWSRGPDLNQRPPGYERAFLVSGCLATSACQTEIPAQPRFCCFVPSAGSGRALYLSPQIPPGSQNRGLSIPPRSVCAMPSETAVPGAASTNTPGGRRGERCFQHYPSFHPVMVGGPASSTSAGAEPWMQRRIGYEDHWLR